jgi:hypothetical protein
MSNLAGGAKRKSRRAASKSRKPRKSTRKQRASRKSRPQIPKTARLPSKRSKSVERMRASKANTGMSLTELQFLAKSRGIPFGGLTKTKLARKINNYY